MIACTKAPSLSLTTAKAFSFEANRNIRVAQKASKLVSSKMQHNTKRHGFENHPASRPNPCSHRTAPPRSKTPKANIKFSFEANPNIRVAQKASKLVSSKMQHNTKRHGFEHHPASRPNLCSHRSAPPRSKTQISNIKFEF